MDIEEIKSTAPGADYINIGKPVSELGMEYIPIMFDEKNLLAYETLCDLFDQNCVTNDEGYTNTRAMGFVGDIPTQAYTGKNTLYAFVCGGIFDYQRWQKDLFNNFFCMNSSELCNHTTILDTYNDHLIEVEFQGDSRILMRFYATLV
jgi:hypothetical protein